MKKLNIKSTKRNNKGAMPLTTKIKVQNKLSTFTAVFLSFLTLLGIAALIYFLVAADDLSGKTRGEIIGLIGLLAFLIPLFFKSTDAIDEFLSELILTPKTLTLVYQYKKKKRNEIIPLEDIESVSADLTANIVRQGKTAYLNCQTDVTINKKDGEPIFFDVNPSGGFSFCGYDFLLKLISISYFLPNFKYTVSGDSEFAKDDIKHYERYGKRMSFWQRSKYEIKNTPLIGRIFLVISFLLIIDSVGFMIYINIPTFCTKEEKEFVSYIDEGYRAYQYNSYEISIEKYEKALTMFQDDSTLYYYMALTYKGKGEYKKAVECAKKGIACLNKKSKYYKVHNYKFISNDGIGLYTTLGDCYLQLENYSEAKDAYTYIIDHAKYKYSNAHFYRGICEYYLGDKDGALKDFIEYKSMLEVFFAEEEEREYKYETYSQEDLDIANAWINAAMAL